jgi:GxxExxY protein
MEKDNITYRIIGCVLEVHKTLGNGFQEVIYQRCQGIELEKAGISFCREVNQNIYYKGQHIGTRRAYFIINGNVMVELKVLISLEDINRAQAKNYLIAYNLEAGILLYIGDRSLEYK